MHDLNILIRHLLVDTFLEFKICEIRCWSQHHETILSLLIQDPLLRQRLCVNKSTNLCVVLKNFFLIFCLDRDILSTVFPCVLIHIPGFPWIPLFQL